MRCRRLTSRYTASSGGPFEHRGSRADDYLAAMRAIWSQEQPAYQGSFVAFAGVHARSAVGGFDGRFSIETEIIVAIPPTLARAILLNRGWVFPLPPVMLQKLLAQRGYNVPCLTYPLATAGHAVDGHAAQQTALSIG